MSMTDFCNNNKQSPIRLSVKSYVNAGEHPIYGSVTTTTREIEMTHDKTLWLQDAQGRVTGSIKFNRFELDMRRGLVEYLSEGW